MMTNNCQMLFCRCQMFDLEWECKGELECLQVVENGRADIAARFSCKVCICHRVVVFHRTEIMLCYFEL